MYKSGHNGPQPIQPNPTPTLARVAVRRIHPAELTGAQSKRAFATHQRRLPREYAAEGITAIEAASRYRAETCQPAFNAEFTVETQVSGTAFVPLLRVPLDTVLGEHFERTLRVEITHLALQAQ